MTQYVYDHFTGEYLRIATPDDADRHDFTLSMRTRCPVTPSRKDIMFTFIRSLFTRQPRPVYVVVAHDIATDKTKEILVFRRHRPALAAYNRLRQVYMPELVTLAERAAL